MGIIHKPASAEIGTIYVDNDDRYIVSLIVGYQHDDAGGAGGVRSAKEAAFFALDLTQDDGWDGTHWVVHDRVTGETHVYEQEDFAQWGDGGFVFKDEDQGDDL